MNCKQANAVPISIIMESFSLFPSKQNRKSAFYFALDREERTPSLLVDYSNNTAFDFGTGKKYDVISIVQLIKRCSVAEALSFISLNNFSQTFSTPGWDVAADTNCIDAVTDVKHPALIDYLTRRKLNTEIGELVEIRYCNLGKTFFGVGFKNDSGGYEISNALKFKRCLGRKDITSICNAQSILRMFESWSDYLSFKVINNSSNHGDADYVVLNSVSMIQRFARNPMGYASVELFFDNDDAGDRATELLKQQFTMAQDQRFLYSDHKDLNEFLKSRK
ncbi:toprim domain-containing protein [Dyadobacter flavalbus]|uniref:Toprim domain-containing protein n=2 Tax=Dyadobacter flavalbus TaxID=2579942 RepID=A0A5M8QR25_9BACT|nr:toprim domain-containing protein [Dyadobacter flavalbus]